MIVVSLLVLFGLRPSAQILGLNPFQNLTFTVFERYLESLRLQAGIPGMSALILQDGVVVWERGFGRADIERQSSRRRPPVSDRRALPDDGRDAAAEEVR